MVKRAVASILVLAILAGSVRSAYATVATGAITDRGVFTLTVAGAAKLGLAESQIATAVRILGVLGKVSSAVTVGFVVYEVATGLWDWWNASYDQGAAGVVAAPGTLATYGVQSGVGIGQCQVAQYWFASSGAYGGGFDYSSTCPGSGFIPVGQTLIYQYSGDWTIKIVLLNIMANPNPAAASAHAAAGAASGRAAFVAALDAAVADLSTTQSVDQPMVSGTTTYTPHYTGPSLAAAVAALNAARNVVANGVALGAGDHSAENGSASIGTMPGAIPASGETTATDTGAATVSALGAVSSAIAASQAAVVSAVNAATAAVSASQAAVVSAVQAVAAPIVAAISASQAAVVSAVQAVAAPIVAAIQDLKAQEAAQDQAATDKAASPAATVPAFTCPVCTRQDKWNDFWVTLKEAGMAAPVFGLISKLVINPSSGTGACAVRTISTSRMGSLTIDPAVWNCSTLVAVFRFAILGTCVIVAYMILFG